MFNFTDSNSDIQHDYTPRQGTLLQRVFDTVAMYADPISLKELGDLLSDAHHPSVTAYVRRLCVTGVFSKTGEKGSFKYQAIKGKRLCDFSEAKYKEIMASKGAPKQPPAPVKAAQPSRIVEMQAASVVPKISIETSITVCIGEHRMPLTRTEAIALREALVSALMHM
jgi:hypothetical protein